MTGLAPGENFYYYSLDGSPVMMLRNKPEHRVYAIFADLGFANDVSIPQLTAEVNAGEFDIVILAGDQSYNFETTGGKVHNLYQPCG